MARQIRYLALVLPLLLAACGSGGGTPTAAATTGAAATSPAGPVAGPGAGGGFTLEEGTEHDVCGIGVIVKFIPSSASASRADEAVIIGGPVNNVADPVQNHTGDQPLPANAAKATPGTTVTVAGKRFLVNAVDVAGTRVQLEPHC